MCSVPLNIYAVQLNLYTVQHVVRIQLLYFNWTFGMSQSTNTNDMEDDPEEACATVYPVIFSTQISFFRFNMWN